MTTTSTPTNPDVPGRKTRRARLALRASKGRNKARTVVAPSLSNAKKASAEQKSPRAAGRVDANPLHEFIAYKRDLGERMILFWDTLRERANNMLEHERVGLPPLLDFKYETLLDARRFERSANYALLRITEVGEHCSDACVDANKPPVIVVDPGAGHGPGIGVFKRDSEVGMAMRESHPVYFVIKRQWDHAMGRYRGLAKSRALAKILVEHRLARPGAPAMRTRRPARWSVSRFLSLVRAPTRAVAPVARGNSQSEGGLAARTVPVCRTWPHWVSHGLGPPVSIQRWVGARHYREVIPASARRRVRTDILQGWPRADAHGESTTGRQNRRESSSSADAIDMPSA